MLKQPDIKKYEIREMNNGEFHVHYLYSGSGFWSELPIVFYRYVDAYDWIQKEIDKNKTPQIINRWVFNGN